MKFPKFILAAMVVTNPLFAVAGEDAAEVDTVVAAVKAANPDQRALCQGGPDGIRKAVSAAIMPLVGQGKIKGNPQAVGGEAGQKIGRECRGG